MKRWILIVLLLIIGYQHYRIISLESDVQLLAKGVKIALRHELEAARYRHQVLRSVRTVQDALIGEVPR